MEGTREGDSLRHPEADIRGWLADDGKNVVDEYTARRIKESFDRIPRQLRDYKKLGTTAALDAGSGAGFDSFALACHFDRVVAIDSARQPIALAKRIAAATGVRNIDFLQGDILDMRRSSEFDFVWCNVMSHNVRSRLRLLHLLHDVLNNGGGLSYSEACEAYGPMEIGHAIQSQDAAALVDRLRQVVAGFSGRPDFRFFFSGTFAAAAGQFGFHLLDTRTSSWNGLAVSQEFRCRRSDGSFSAGFADPDYVELPEAVLHLRPWFRDVAGGRVTARPTEGPGPAWTSYGTMVLDAVTGPLYPTLARRALRRVLGPGRVDWDRAAHLHSEFVESIPR